jgi:hypothetical protein
MAQSSWLHHVFFIALVAAVLMSLGLVASTTPAAAVHRTRLIPGRRRLRGAFCPPALDVCQEGRRRQAAHAKVQQAGGDAAVADRARTVEDAAAHRG